MAILDSKIPENLRTVTIDRLVDAVGKSIIVKYGKDDHWTLVCGLFTCLRVSGNSAGLQVFTGDSSEIVPMDAIIYFYSNESAADLVLQFGGDALLE